MLGKCAAASLPCMRVKLKEDSKNFRNDFAAFRAMGAVKVRRGWRGGGGGLRQVRPVIAAGHAAAGAAAAACLVTPPGHCLLSTPPPPQVRFVLELLEAHPTLHTAVVSDSDTVWLRPPWPYLDQRPAADFFVSTDCLSVQVRPVVGYPAGCRAGCRAGRRAGRVTSFNCHPVCPACSAALPADRWRTSGGRPTTSHAAATSQATTCARLQGVQATLPCPCLAAAAPCPVASRSHRPLPCPALPLELPLPPTPRSGRAFNTGIFAARNAPATRTFLAAWADMLTDPERERHSDPARRGIDDQMALNLLFQEGDPIVAASDGARASVGRGRAAGLAGTAGCAPPPACCASAVSPPHHHHHHHSPTDDPRSILVWSRKLRVQPLPASLFANGHVAFVQRLPWRGGFVPMLVHATFQRYGAAGKRGRLREHGLWYQDAAEYYGATGNSSSNSSGSSSSESSSSESITLAGSAGSAASGGGAGLTLLTYANDVVQWIAQLDAERQRGGGSGGGPAPGIGIPLMEKHWLAVSYQLLALR